MILSHIDQISRYENFHPGFQFAFDFLKNLKANEVQVIQGKPLQGNKIFLNQNIVQAQPKADHEVAILESHQKYIDVQYVLQGQNRMGWSPVEELKGTGKGYQELNEDLSGDYELYDAVPKTWFNTPPGTIAIFFPEDGHAPLNGNEEITKVVVKVAIDF